MSARPVCFVGMSGCGKSHWSRVLASRDGFGWHDCDAMIAARLGEIVRADPGEAPVRALGRWMGMPWSDGYEEREARYMTLEEAVTREALDAAARGGAKQIVDTTGSVVYLPQPILDSLRRKTHVVYLRTPPEARAAMLRRYLEEPKPVVWGGLFEPWSGERPEDALPRCYSALLAWRDNRYAALAHVILDAAELERDDGLAAIRAAIAGPS